MAILDNLAKGVKDFFVEEGHAAPAATAAARPLPAAPAPALADLAPGQAQPEQRHLDHIARDGRDFHAFTKMVKSLAASGLSGPLLYQTAFNAFSAVTGLDFPTLLTSADALTQKLADDRAKVQAHHREKTGEAVPLKGAPSALAQLRNQEAQLQADVAALSKQLAEKSQQLQEAQQQMQQESTKAQAALASYELANAAAVAELQVHQQATKSFLLNK
jgi:outer membrane receptor for Fe3+-dicitrate